MAKENGTEATKTKGLDTAAIKERDLLTLKAHKESPVIEFDMDVLSAIELGKFMGNVTGQENIIEMSDILSRIVTKCPKEWGANDDPGTYKVLSWRIIWKQVIFPAFREALKNDESE